MKLNGLMFVRIFAIALLYCLLSPSLYARSTALVEPDPVTLDCDLPEKKMKAGIRNGAAMRGWVIVNQTPGNVEIRYVKGNNKHTIIVNVRYTSNTFDVTYKDSTNLKYSVKKGVRQLHPNAIGWMANLSGDIQMNTNGLCFDD